MKYSNNQNENIPKTKFTPFLEEITNSTSPQREFNTRNQPGPSPRKKNVNLFNSSNSNVSPIQNNNLNTNTNNNINGIINNEVRLYVRKLNRIFFLSCLLA